MIELLKNHLVRAWQKKARLFLMIALILASLSLALFLSERTQHTVNLAVVGEQSLVSDHEHVQITQLKKRPATSKLVLGLYDAVIDLTGATPEIITVKSADSEKQIRQLLAGEAIGEQATAESSSKAKMLLGYMLMFLLAAGVTNTFLFSEDKEKHLMERMICSGLSQGKLFFSYVLFLFGLLFVPVMLIFIGMNQLLQVDLGLPLTDYAYLLALICMVGVSFALCNASFFKDSDQANMIGSMILVITSLISGSFFSIAEESGWWLTATKYLPQKQFLQIVEQISSGQSYGAVRLKIVYLVGISALFLVITIWKNRKTYQC